METNCKVNSINYTRWSDRINLSLSTVNNYLSIILRNYRVGNYLYPWILVYTFRSVQHLASLARDIHVQMFLWSIWYIIIVRARYIWPICQPLNILNNLFDRQRGPVGVYDTSPRALFDGFKLNSWRLFFYRKKDCIFTCDDFFHWLYFLLIN